MGDWEAHAFPNLAHGGIALKKKILMAVVALVLLGGLGAGAMFVLKMLRKPAAAAAPAAATPAAAEAAPVAAVSDDDEDEPAAKGGEEGAAGPAVMVLKSLIVNLESQHRNAFLKCELNILFRDAELGRLATSEKPTPENAIIRSIVLDALSGKTVEEASDVEARESIRQDIKEKLNARFASRMRTKEALEKAQKTGKPVKPPIRDVLVVDWAIQQ
jgi:flagellar basal body-associated protein FliL